MELSEGAIETISMEGQYPDAVLQVLNIFKKDGGLCFWITMSDGRRMSMFVLPTELNSMVEDNLLEPNCICLLKKSETHLMDDGRPVVIILEVEVIKTAKDVAGKIGDPIFFVGNCKEPWLDPMHLANLLQFQNNGNDVCAGIMSLLAGNSKEPWSNPMDLVRLLNPRNRNDVCADTMKLSEGAIETITMGGQYPDAVLQVLNVRKVVGVNGRPRFRIMMSDGRHMSYFVLPTQMNSMAEDNLLEPNCICLLKKSELHLMKRERRAVLIVEMEVLKTAKDVAGKIGDPIPFVEGDRRVTAPSVHPLQPQNGNDVCADTMKLSEGAIEILSMGGQYPDAVLQLLNVHKEGSILPLFGETMSDGRHTMIMYALSLQLTADENLLEPNCICLLKKTETHLLDDGRRVVIIVEMEVLKNAEDVAGKIGDPIPFDEGNCKGPQSAPAPSVRPLQPQNGNDGDSPRALDITRSPAEMTVKDLQPLSVVEDEGFRNFVKLLDPRYKIASRKSLMEGTMAETHEECRSKVRKSLDGAKSVVLTTGVWTSRDKEAYLPVSCHVIDENWQTQAYVLEASSFAGQCSADNVCSELNRITDEWGITDKVAAVVTGSGANMVAAVRKAGWAHYTCFPHSLILVVRDSIKALPDLLHIKQRCSAVVHFFHHSRTAAERLKEVQKELKRPEHKLIQSDETRWDSVFYMLESLSEQKEAVTTVLGLLGKSSLCLSEEDWSTISLSVDALRPFEEVTREILTGKHGSVSNVIPLVSLLLRATASHERKGSKLAAELSVQCQRQFKGVESFYCLAASTFLDTRFKSLGFGHMANVGPIKGRLMAEMQLVSQTSTTPVTTPSFPAGAAASPPAPKAGIWEEFDTRVLASLQRRKAGADVLIEMRRFSEEEVIPRDQDPLLWWKNNEKMFPCLSKLAKKYLVISCHCVTCTCRKEFL